ncbi:MAG: Gfo/Idh/MocA family oxidoreductase [Bacteroidales bacterium]|nr:Gfo/Idh/MocA family oxidoreductase [Bacteroidales bacterium]
MIRFGVVGCGHIGKRHAAMIQGNAECGLAALCDIRPREQLGLEAFDVPFHTDFTTMLDTHPDMDVVNICVPNGLHASMAIQAMEKGFHVVVEKPLALKTKDADAILECVRQTGKKVFCVMQNRYSPPSVWMKKLVDSGRLGDIEIVQLNCYWNRDERYYVPDSWHGSADLDGGTLFTQFSHFIDIMAWLFGDIADIRGRFRDFRHQQNTAFEDSGLLQFNFVRGGIGCLNYSTAVFDKNLESSLTVVAANGSIRIGGQYMDKVEYCHIKDYVMPELPPTNPGNDYGAYKGSAQNHHYVIQNVVDVLSGQNASITATAEEGRLVVDMIERIYALR